MSRPQPLPKERLHLIRGQDAAEEAEEPALGGLVRSALSGDRSSQEALVRRFYPSTVSLAFRLLGDRDQAQEVAQEVFVVFARQLDRLREPERIAGWLRSITVNLSRKCIRARMRHRARFVTLDPVDIDAHFETGETTPEARLLVQRLYAALDTLKPDQRLAVVLRDVEGMTWEEMQRAAGSSVSTLKRRHREAQRRLKRKLDTPHG